jgi:class 3 adenylate cyclase
MPTERRLAAILAADVVGYSRLMGADEIGTLRALKALRGDLLDPVIADHRGRIVKTTGDGLLVEFASVVDAVVCAVAIQHDLASLVSRVRGHDRLTLRIGVNIGDIIIDGADIFGDGVNIASRLEAICEPGGVTMSRAAHEQVRDKLAFPFVDLGERNVKNIARPVQVFGVGPEAIGAMARPVPPGRTTLHSSTPVPARARAQAREAPELKARISEASKISETARTSEASKTSETARTSETSRIWGSARGWGSARTWRRRLIVIAILALVLSRQTGVRHAVDALIAWVRAPPMATATPATTTPTISQPRIPLAPMPLAPMPLPTPTPMTPKQPASLAPLPPEIFVPSRPDPAGTDLATDPATAPPIELHPQD